MRYLFGILIFPSDGTSRIRFTGQSQQAHSQPDASGPPKTYLLGVDDIIPILAKNVKHAFVGRSHDSADALIPLYGYRPFGNPMCIVFTHMNYIPGRRGHDPALRIVL